MHWHQLRQSSPTTARSCISAWVRCSGFAEQFVSGLLSVLDIQIQCNRQAETFQLAVQACLETGRCSVSQMQ